jgi:LPXTG-motif cell wall-anchored protein
MDALGLGTGTYWICVDESTLPASQYGWDSTTGSNPQQVSYKTGVNDFSIDFGYKLAGPPTAVTLFSFAVNSGAGGSVNPLWLGLAGLTMLAAGSLFWVKRRAD